MTPEAAAPGLMILTGEGTGGTARDDRRLRIESEIEETALGLFAARGFESVTIDEIADAAGISRRTFFRYFGSKEELLLRDVRRRIDGFVETLRARPVDENILVSLREASTTMSAGYQADRETLMTLMQIITAEPAILARNIGEPIALIDSIVSTVADRLGTDPATDLRPSILAISVIEACNMAMRMWMLNPGTDLTVLATRALDLVEPGLESIVAAAPTGI